MAKKLRNRAAQDVNLINLRALKKRVAQLEEDRRLDRLRAEQLADAVTRLHVQVW